MSTQTAKTREPILGYEVTERIGAGGYGEVWRATAPGGLTKAIKFVYGYLDDERAKRELKALSRIKLVRHPFLLSLERIEVVDGQLVIITELADMSLKDRQDECKAAGMVGIPREELLGYLHDAADALDYMREKFSLQHLDIKPENLLLLGNHVKVADFGLVKDIEDTRASMMGGLTPIYASPEVFDDRPSQCSDQYSLAILYQELLTGTLPFPGKTTAQLAAQHLQSRPRLTALTPEDKPIIERALSKAPDQRFPDCRTMVTALVAAGRSHEVSNKGNVAAADTTPLAVNETHHVRPAPAQQPAPPAASEGRTQTLAERQAEQAGRSAAQPSGADQTGRDGVPLEHVTSQSGNAIEPSDEFAAPSRDADVGSPAEQSFHPAELPAHVAAPLSRTGEVPQPVARRARVAPVVNDLAPLALAVEPCWRPALFVGIGGSGRLVLEQLRGRLVDRFGRLEDLPAIRLLAADTDALGFGDGRDAPWTLSTQETQTLPLRRSEDYRCGSNKLLAWMSRRWLYNIPRSLQTEGLRPLGRLALVDHATALVERLNAALAAICDSSATKTTAEKVSAKRWETHPRVFLVASIAGGTGSGMTIDVAYLLAKLLKDRGLSSDLLQVILLHSTPRNQAAHDLAVANAYAALSELAHYGQHGYPGEEACGLPALGVAEARLPNVYLVNLGSELGEPELATGAGSIAEYLFLNTMTSAGAWLDEARQSVSSAASEDFSDVPLRTFGVCDLGCSRELVAKAADEVGVALVERWSGERHSRRHEPTASAGTAPAPSAGHAWSSAEIDRLARDRMAMMRLSAEEVSINLRQLVEEALGRDLPSYLAAEVATLLQGRSPERPAGGEAEEELTLVEQLDRLLGATAEEAAEESAPSWALAIDQFLKEAVRLRGERLRTWSRELVDNPNARLKGATRALEGVARQVRELRDSVQAARARAAEDLRTAAALIAKARGRTRSWHGLGSGGHAATDVSPLLVQYGEMKFHERILASVAKLMQLLGWELSNIVDQLKEAQRELALLAVEFMPDDRRRHRARESTSEAAGAIAAAVRDMLSEQNVTLVDRLDAQFQEQFARVEGGLCGRLAQGAESRGELVGALRAKARGLVLETIQAAAMGEKLLARDASQGGHHDLLRACLAESTPALLPCGGDRRLLIMTASEQDAAPLVQAVTDVTGHAPSVVVDTSNEPALCYEVAALPLANAAAALIDGQPHCAQLAARLHTRCDLDWSRLLEA